MSLFLQILGLFREIRLRGVSLCVYMRWFFFFTVILFKARFKSIEREVVVAELGVVVEDRKEMIYEGGEG